MFKKHWEKYPSCVIVLLFMVNIAMCGFCFSFDSIVHYDDALVDQLLILYNPPSFINLLGSIGYYLFGLFLILMDWFTDVASGKFLNSTPSVVYD